MYTLKVNVWPVAALDLPGVERTNALEERQQSFVGTPHVSRTHGGQFRKALSEGRLTRSSVEHRFRVSFIMTPEARSNGSPVITSEYVIRDVTVVGLLELKFDRSDLEAWDAIRVVSLDGTVVSPPQYSATGVHELRFFNRASGTVLGEWDSNPVPDCIMNEHWIEKKN